MTHQASPRAASPFATQQRWLMSQATLAKYFRNEAEQPGTGVLAERFIDAVLTHDLASRNTAGAFLREMLKYGLVRHVAGSEGRGRRPIEPSPGTLAILQHWLAIHLATLDSLDGGLRSTTLQARPDLLAAMQPIIAEGLLASKTVRQPNGTFSLFTWINDGGIVMDRLIAGSRHDARGLACIPTDVMSVSALSQNLNLSRTQLSRKFVAAEAMGSLGWTRGRGKSPLWGADHWLSPNTLVGISVAGGASNFAVSNGGSGQSDLFQTGVFLRHTIGSGYITAAAAYGWQDVTTDRTVTVAGLDRLRGRFNANSYAGRIEIGSRSTVAWLYGVGITPYAAAQVVAIDLPTYAESVVAGSNAFALSYNGKTVTSPRTELGLRSDKSFALDGAWLTLRGRAAWAHDTNTDRAASATFQALPGASFVVNGAAAARNAALTTASAELTWINGLSLAATFEGEFSDVTRSYAGKGTVRYVW